MSEQSGEYYGDVSVDDEDQLQPEDTLDDRGVDDVLDEGYSPPEREPAHLRNAPTGEEEHEGETLDERLAQEEPEPDPYAEDDVDPDSEDNPAYAAYAEGTEEDARAGRLVAPDEGVREDHDQAGLADDVGIDGAGASAEEAAMHVEGDL